MMKVFVGLLGILFAIALFEALLYFSHLPEPVNSAPAAHTTVAQPGIIQLPVDHLNSEDINPTPEKSFKGPFLYTLPESQWVFCAPDIMWVTNKGQYFINGFGEYRTVAQPNDIKVARKGDTWIVSLNGTTTVWTAMKLDISPNDHRTVTMQVTEIKP
jgi:hypothetical protein